MFSCAYTNPILYSGNAAHNDLAGGAEGKVLSIDTANNSSIAHWKGNAVMLNFARAVSLI